MSKRQQTLIYRFREKFAIAKDRHKIIAETYIQKLILFHKIIRISGGPLNKRL